MTTTALIFQKRSIPRTSTKLNGTWICLAPLKSQPCISSLSNLCSTNQIEQIYLQQFYSQKFWTRYQSMMFWLIAKICLLFKQKKVYIWPFTPKWKHVFESWDLLEKKWNLWFPPISALSSLVPAQVWNLGNPVIATLSLCISWSCQVAPAVFCATEKEAQLLLLLSTKTDSLAHSAALEIYDCLGIGSLFMGH